MSRKYVLTVRLAPEEILVVKQLANAFTAGDQSEFVRFLLHQLGEYTRLLTAGDVAHLEHKPPRHRAKKEGE